MAEKVLQVNAAARIASRGSIDTGSRAGSLVSIQVVSSCSSLYFPVPELFLLHCIHGNSLRGTEGFQLSGTEHLSADLNLVRSSLTASAHGG